MKLAFRVDANHLSGFGHFSRCVNLCRTWQDTGSLQKVSFVGNYNTFALQVLEHYALPYEFINSENYASLCEESLIKFDVVVFDSYFINQETLTQITGLPFKSILIDDECLWNYEGIDAVVNFRFEAEKMYRYNAKKAFLGIDYFVVKPELLSLRKRNSQRTEHPISHILLFLGGAFSDPDFLNRIVHHINDKFPNITINCIGMPPQQKGLRFIHHSSTFEIEKIFGQVDGIINGGGIIKYEAGYSLIPTAAFSVTQLQFEDSLVLDKFNANFNLGLIDKGNEDSIFNRLDIFLSQDNVRNAQIEANKKNYTDNPTKNLIRQLIKL